MKVQAFVLDLLERALFTFVETFAAAMLVPNLSMSAFKSAGLAGMASVFALLKGSAAAFLGEKGTAAVLPEPDKPYVAPVPPAGPVVVAQPAPVVVAPAPPPEPVVVAQPPPPPPPPPPAPPEEFIPRGGKDED